MFKLMVNVLLNISLSWGLQLLYFFLPLQQRNAPERFYVGSWQKKREVGCSKILSSESTGTAEINRELKYRKIPKISPSMYKPLQI